MSICDGCIHDYVCGLEDNHEEGIVSCADRIPKDVLDKIRAELHETAEMYDDGDCYLRDEWIDEIFDEYKAIYKSVSSTRIDTKALKTSCQKSRPAIV